MSKAYKAFEDIKNFANKLKPLFEAADALEEIGNIELHTNELKAEKAKAEAELVDAKKLLAEKVESYEVVQKNVEKVLNHTKQLEIDVMKKSDDLKNKANLEAAAIISEANKVKFQIEDDVKVKKMELSALHNSIEEGKSLVAAIKREINETKQRLNNFMGS